MLIEGESPQPQLDLGEAINQPNLEIPACANPLDTGEGNAGNSETAQHLLQQILERRSRNALLPSTSPQENH